MFFAYCDKNNLIDMFRMRLLAALFRTYQIKMKFVLFLLVLKVIFVYPKNQRDCGAQRIINFDFFAYSSSFRGI